MKKNLKFLLIVFILFVGFVVVQLCLYRLNLKLDEKYVSEHCKNSADSYIYENISGKKESLQNPSITPAKNPKSCYCRMYTSILPHLLVYKVKSAKQDLKFVKFTFNEAYVVPTTALEKADVFVTYGMTRNSDFEDNAANLYKKDTYFYACGFDQSQIKSPYIHFENECLGTEKNSLPNDGQIERTHIFSDNLQKANLQNKKIYLKLDVSGAEQEMLPDILKYSDNILGMSISVNIEDLLNIDKSKKSLELIEKDFVLVYRTNNIFKLYNVCGCKYMGKVISPVVSLSYINKNFVDTKYLPFDQNYQDPKKYVQINFAKQIFPELYISPIVVLNEKIKNILKK